MNKKPFLLILLLFSILVLSSKIAKSDIASEPFGLYIPSNGKLGFQNDINRTVLLDVSSGLLNSTDIYLSTNEGGGTLTFTSINTTTINLAWNGVSNVKIGGDNGNPLRVAVQDEVVHISIGDRITIIWDITFSPLFPVMFLLFMFGLGCTVGGPMYGIHQIRHKNYRDALSYTTIITAIGISFVIAYLWS